MPVATIRPKSHVGVAIAGRILGISPAAVLRLALLGDVPYVVSPDRKPLFEVSALKALRGKLTAGQGGAA
jgi:hypothetical protein